MTDYKGMYLAMMDAAEAAMARETACRGTADLFAQSFVI